MRGESRGGSGGERSWLEQASAAALVIQPFTILYGVLLAWTPPTAQQLHASDPLVQLFAALAGLWSIPVAATAVLLVWWLIRPPSRAALARAGWLGAAAVLVVVLVMPAGRVLVGPTLPAFIPPEESAKPGMLLGLAAGLIEEVIFRLVVLPVGLSVGARFTSRRGAAWGAVLGTALLFALSHEVGPGAAAFSPVYFLDRFLFPGVLMSAAFFWPGAPFICTLHCAVHVLLPLLFA